METFNKYIFSSKKKTKILESIVVLTILFCNRVSSYFSKSFRAILVEILKLVTFYYYSIDHAR